jgi:hypothetical protein
MMHTLLMQVQDVLGPVGVEGSVRRSMDDRFIPTIPTGPWASEKNQAGRKQ